MSERLRKAEQIGRPVGGAEFIAALERQTGRRLPRERPGPKPKGDESDGGIWNAALQQPQLKGAGMKKMTFRYSFSNTVWLVLFPIASAIINSFLQSDYIDMAWELILLMAIIYVIFLLLSSSSSVCIDNDGVIAVSF
jgi:hypothetical protein